MEDSKETMPVVENGSSAQSPEDVVRDVPENSNAAVSGVVPASPAEPVAATPGGAVSAHQTTSGLAVAGLVLGILAILGAFVPLLNILTAPFAIVGLILAVVGLLGINKGKHSGKGIAIAGVVLGAVALVVTVGMYGCAGAVAGSSSGNSTSAASSQTSGVQEASDFVGTWDIVGMKDAEHDYGKEDIDQARSNGSDFFLNLYEDGTCVFLVGSQEHAAKGKWEAKGADAFKLVFDDMTVEAPVKDGKATLEINGSVFELEKIDTMKSLPAATGAASASASSSESEQASAAESEDGESGEVSADVKEALDSYEAVMDEYVSFMQKYKDSGYSADMLSDYTAMLQKYTEFSEKINAMDTSSMSSADYAYYIEVTGRVSQKLMEVAQ